MAKIKVGKTSQVFSDNPKMGTPYVRGYRNGGGIEEYFSGRGLKEALKKELALGPYDPSKDKTEIERGPYDPSKDKTKIERLPYKISKSKDD